MWLFSFSNTIYWRDYLFPIEYSWLTCHLLVGHICEHLFLDSWLFFTDLCVSLYSSAILFISFLQYCFNHYILEYSLKSGSVIPLVLFFFLRIALGFPSGSDSKASVCNTGDPGSIPGFGRSPGEGNGSPLQYSCLENPMDRGAWQATVHGVAQSCRYRWLYQSEHRVQKQIQI